MTVSKRKKKQLPEKQSQEMFDNLNSLYIEAMEGVQAIQDDMAYLDPSLFDLLRAAISSLKDHIATNLATNPIQNTAIYLRAIDDTDWITNQLESLSSTIKEIEKLGTVQHKNQISSLLRELKEEISVSKRQFRI